jgi:hypothetical protein
MVLFVVCKTNWLESLKGKRHSENLGEDGEIKVDIMQMGLLVKADFIWLRIGTGGWLL